MDGGSGRLDMKMVVGLAQKSNAQNIHLESYCFRHVTDYKKLGKYSLNSIASLQRINYCPVSGNGSITLL